MLHSIQLVSRIDMLFLRCLIFQEGRMETKGKLVKGTFFLCKQYRHEKEIAAKALS